MFCQKPSSPSKYPYDCAVTEKQLGVYEIKISPFSSHADQAEKTVDEIIHLMQQKHLTYQDAMTVSTILNKRLSRTIGRCVAESCFLPLPDNGDDQRDCGD